MLHTWRPVQSYTSPRCREKMERRYTLPALLASAHRAFVPGVAFRTEQVSVPLSSQHGSLRATIFPSLCTGTRSALCIRLAPGCRGPVRCLLSAWLAGAEAAVYW